MHKRRAMGSDGAATRVLRRLTGVMAGFRMMQKDLSPFLLYCPLGRCARQRSGGGLDSCHEDCRM